MATKLGADCPFFVNNKPAYATGIGDILEPVDLDLSGYHFVLIKPPIHISTPDAYSGVIPQTSNNSLRDLVQIPLEQWKHHIKNDFEKSVFEKLPEIGKLKMQLYDAGAIYASMSGSGSSLFGIFKEKPTIELDTKYFVWEKIL